jgi:hypothetical protein
MTRIRVCGTVDSAIARELDLEHAERERAARKYGGKIPTQSDTLQDILKKGLIRSKAVQ